MDSNQSTIMEKMIEADNDLNLLGKSLRQDNDIARLDFLDMIELKHESVMSLMEDKENMIKDQQKDFAEKFDLMCTSLKDNNKRKLSKIKDICATFFQKIEKQSG